jgi:hypothetical protein
MKTKPKKRQKLSFYGHKVEDVLRAFMEVNPAKNRKSLINKRMD